MTYSLFIPSDGLVKMSRWTIQALAIIGALALIALAGTLALHVIAGFCEALIIAIHAVAEVCQSLVIAVGGSPVNIVIVCIVWLVLVLSVKATCILFSSFFQAEGARVWTKETQY